jgi:hypothetical protein
MSQQGQGANTQHKEHCFQDAFTVNMKVLTKPGRYHSSFPYNHCDLHAGEGFNWKADCIGSPIAFLEIVEQFNKRYRAFFCDTDESKIMSLIRRPRVRAAMEEGRECCLFARTNREVIKVFAERIRTTENPQLAMGSILVDPNGCFAESRTSKRPSRTPVFEIIDFCREFERIDIVMNLNVRTMKMTRALVARGESGWVDTFCPDIMEFPALLNRRYWLIRKIKRKGRGDSFVMLIGRNWPYNDNENLGFHHLNSEHGQRIVAATRPL